MITYVPSVFVCVTPRCDACRLRFRTHFGVKIETPNTRTLGKHVAATVSSMCAKLNPQIPCTMVWCHFALLHVNQHMCTLLRGEGAKGRENIA